MEQPVKKRHLKLLEKRKEFLTNRIENSVKDLSFDKAERAALYYVIRLIQKDIEKAEF